MHAGCPSGPAEEDRFPFLLGVSLAVALLVVGPIWPFHVEPFEEPRLFSKVAAPSYILTRGPESPSSLPISVTICLLDYNLVGQISVWF